MANKSLPGAPITVNYAANSIDFVEFSTKFLEKYKEIYGKK